MSSLKRAFSKRQRFILAMLSGNICMECKKTLNKSFHADHIKPWSKGGKTIINNGQSLCPQCNLRKGNKS
ncbi:HNH endonuclease [Pelagibacteraceae bacterium]|nr:HNH endonuclease [Pelagibacteraceae bacterium]